jgi:hypothetical protein
MTCMPLPLERQPNFEEGTVLHMGVLSCAEGHRRVGPVTEVSPKRTGNDWLTAGAEANLALRHARSIDFDPPELNQRVKQLEVRVRRREDKPQHAAKDWMPARAAPTDTETGCDDRHAA